MSNGELPTIGEILLSLRPAQAWALGGALVALITGSFALGVFVENTRNESILSTKDTKISEQEEKIDDQRRALDHLASEISSANARYAALESKTEFLHRYVSYTNSPNDTEKKLFADFVCVMWKESQERKLHLERNSLEVNVDDLIRGVSPDIAQILQDHGIDASGLSDLPTPRANVGKGDTGRGDVTRSTTRRDANDARRLANEVMKQLDQIRVTKTVTFFDGSRYQVPESVAVQVHTRADCAPE